MKVRKKKDILIQILRIICAARLLLTGNMKEPAIKVTAFQSCKWFKTKSRKDTVP